MLPYPSTWIYQIVTGEKHARWFISKSSLIWNNFFVLCLFWWGEKMYFVSFRRFRCVILKIKVFTCEDQLEFQKGWRICMISIKACFKEIKSAKVFWWLAWNLTIFNCKWCESGVHSVFDLPLYWNTNFRATGFITCILRVFMSRY